MPRYLISLGDTTVDPTRICARISAPTKERALERLRALLPLDLAPLPVTGLDKTCEFIEVAFNPNLITLDHIVEDYTQNDEGEEA